MKKQRMQIKELKKLKPSMENPIELVCDDSLFTTLEVIAVYENDFAFLSEEHDGIDVLNVEELKHFNSLKDEPKYETLYECINEGGSLELFFSDATYPMFRVKRKSPGKDRESLTRKTGREF